MRVNGKLQRPEFLLPSNVLHRFTLQPPVQACLEGSRLLCTEGAGCIDVKMRTGRSQHVRQQHFCSGLRLRHPALLQAAYSVPESRPDGLTHPSTACSFAVRSASDNASTTSSNFPAIISSSLYRVSWMRWSVRRLWGKLYVRIRSLRSPLPICARRCSESCAWCSPSRMSISLARKTFNALARFLCCDFSSWQVTTMRKSLRSFGS